MAGESSRSSGKRPLAEEDEEFNKKPPAKRVRFPKGKKVKPGDEIVEIVNVPANVEEDESDLTNPRAAAKERAKRRSQFTSELFCEETGAILNDVTAAEMRYEDNENFVDDGIQIEPFNLNKEREEGYFDASGNFIEYVRDNEIKDAWLDNVEVDPRYAALASVERNEEEEEEEAQELSSKDIGIIKRRIADVLEPEETVLQCLRRLKGNSDRKTKMSSETKIVFDQLTEDAARLMENGEYNVYHEKKEIFEREAEGYEKVARAKGEGTSLLLGEGNFYLNGEEKLLSYGRDSGVASTLTTAVGTSNPHLASAEVSGNGDDFDMFGDDDEPATTKPFTDENSTVSQPSSDAINSGKEGEALQNDYVYDESSVVIITQVVIVT